MSCSTCNFSKTSGSVSGKFPVTRSRCSSKVLCQNADRTNETHMRKWKEFSSCVEKLQKTVASTVIASAFGAAVICSGADAKYESVNRPDLLPNEQTPVLDVAGFLTQREKQRLVSEINSLENDTGVKLRLLAQSYPETPGLAVKEYWGVDDDTVVFVADPTFGGILNFNVGGNVDLKVPRTFWSRLTGKFGNRFYWRDKGENTAIVNAVGAIDACVREPPSRLQCGSIVEVEP